MEYIYIPLTPSSAFYCERMSLRYLEGQRRATLGHTALVSTQLSLLLPNSIPGCIGLTC